MNGFEDVEARLENWSRVQRLGSGPGWSATHRICVYLNTYYGSPKNFVREGERCLDYKDADLVEKAVCALPANRRRDVLAIWIRHAHCSYSVIAKKLGVSRRILEGSYCDALRMIRENLEAAERKQNFKKETGQKPPMGK